MKALPVEPSNTPLAIGSRIRAARQAQRMTIGEVAEAVGLTKGFLSRLERDLGSPSVTTLVALCQILSVSIGDLFRLPEAHLTRSGQGPRISMGGEGIVERLLTARPEQRVQVIQSVIEPHGSGESALYAVDCEVEVLYIARAGSSLFSRTVRSNWQLETQCPFPAVSRTAGPIPPTRRPSCSGFWCRQPRVEPCSRHAAGCRGVMRFGAGGRATGFAGLRSLAGGGVSDRSGFSRPACVP